MYGNFFKSSNISIQLMVEDGIFIEISNIVKMIVLSSQALTGEYSVYDYKSTVFFLSLLELNEMRVFRFSV